MAVDEAGMIAAQEGAGLAKFIGVADPFRGIVLGAFVVHFFVSCANAVSGLAQIGAQTVGVKRARQQAVDRDIVFDGFPRQTGDETG